MTEGSNLRLSSMELGVPSSDLHPVLQPRELQTTALSRPQVGVAYRTFHFSHSVLK